MRILIPDSVTHILEGAFFGCTNLFRVSFQGNAPVLGKAVFGRDANATIYFFVGTIGWTNTFGDRPTVASFTTWQDRLVTIGGIDPMDDAARRIVGKLLRSQGIRVEFSSMGGVEFVLVDMDSADAAQKILKKSYQLNGKWIQYFDNWRKLEAGTKQANGKANAPSSMP